MNTKQLNYFLQVVETKSIAAAARQLDIAQPALSLQIAKLEHELKTTLFIRDYRGVQLTEAGALFEAHVRTVLNQLDRALNDIAEAEGNPKGKIVVAMNQASINILAMPLSNIIEQKFPDIELDLRTGLSYEVLDLLNSGEADMAVVYEDGLDNPNIRRELLIKENLFFATSPKAQHKQIDEIKFASLPEYEVVTTSEKESLGHILSEYEKLTGIKLRKRRPYGQLLTGLRFVCEGHCNMILPSSALYHLEETQQIKSLKIVEPEIFRNVYIATDMSRRIRNITLKIIELVKQCTAQEHQKNNWRGNLPTSE